MIHSVCCCCLIVTGSHPVCKEFATAASKASTYCGLALSGQRSGCYPGLCVQAVGSGLCGQQLQAHDESALEVAPPYRRLDRQPTAFTTMRYTNRQPLPLPPA